MKKLAMAMGVLVLAGMAVRVAPAERIRDVVRLKNETPNTLIGMGIVVGLKGTGDGGDFMPTMRPLMAMMKRFDDNVPSEKELKNANNVAIVMLSCRIPPQGAHSGEPLDVKVSALAAKSLKGGELVIVPLFAPRTDAKIVMASANGRLTLLDEAHPTEAVVKGGATLIEDILPEEIHDNQFTLVLNPSAASPEKSTMIADQINEELSSQTGGRQVAFPVDSTSVLVNIPPAEQANPTPFIARIMSQRLPSVPEPATVRISNNTIILTEEVELEPTTIMIKNMTITIGAGPGPVSTPGGQQIADPLHPRIATLRELVNAFDLLKVSAEDRVEIVKKLHEINALKAKLIID